MGGGSSPPVAPSSWPPGSGPCLRPGLRRAAPPAEATLPHSCPGSVPATECAQDGRGCGPQTRRPHPVISRQGFPLQTRAQTQILGQLCWLTLSCHHLGLSSVRGVWPRAPSVTGARPRGAPAQVHSPDRPASLGREGGSSASAVAPPDAGSAGPWDAPRAGGSVSQAGAVSLSFLSGGFPRVHQRLRG